MQLPKIKKSNSMQTLMAQELIQVIPYFLKYKNVWTSYDSEADVLYVHFKKNNIADNSEMTDDDIIIRYADNQIIGLTILNVSERTVLTVW
jgi:uncharacterized protein YuzE